MPKQKRKSQPAKKKSGAKTADSAAARTRKETRASNANNPKHKTGVIHELPLSDDMKTEDMVVYTDCAGQEWTLDQIRLLYLISKFSHYAETAGDKELWIRRIPVLVWIYEGVVQGVFQYDYAPAPQYIGHQAIWMNVSQEGADDIDDLREGGLVNGLKLSNKVWSNDTAYQISRAGKDVLDEFLSMHPQGDACIDPVNKLVYHQATRELLYVHWSNADQHFELTSKDSEPIISKVMDCEDVSYVSSPYLPACLVPQAMKTHPNVEALFSSNASRSQESAGAHNIQEEVKELIHLSNVHVLMGEYIPFGENQILALNDKLGTTERVQGGLFTAVLDLDPSSTNFECSPGLTNVSIRDHDLHTYVAFEADIHYPEDPGIIQIEHFGMCVNASGDVHYGLKLESVLNCEELFSLDHLARVLMDIRQDSSTIIDSLVSAYQRSLLDLVFLGKSHSRPKFNVLIAESISPELPADKYMDKEGYENEIKQVIGPTQNAYQLDSTEVLIIGRRGAILAGPNVRRHEELVVAFVNVMAISLFTQSFFRRTFAVRSQLEAIRGLIDKYESDPNSIPQIRLLHSQTEKEVILLAELLSYLKQSVERFELPSQPNAGDSAACHLWDVLDLPITWKHLDRRVADMFKNIDSARNELRSLQGDINVISENRSFALQEEVQSNTKNLEDVFRSNERASNSLDVLQIILAGTLAFEILDRLTGEWSVIDQPWAQFYIVPFINKPGLWFVINIALWVLIGLMLLYLKNRFMEKSQHVLVLRMKLNKRVDMHALDTYLKTKPVAEESVDFDLARSVRKVHWEETRVDTWMGLQPTIEIQFDSRYGFLLFASFTVSKPPTGKLDENTLRQYFFRELSDHKVFRNHTFLDTNAIAAGLEMGSSFVDLA